MTVTKALELIAEEVGLAEPGSLALFGIPTKAVGESATLPDVRWPAEALVVDMVQELESQGTHKLLCACLDSAGGVDKRASLALCKVIPSPCPNRVTVCMIKIPDEAPPPLPPSPPTPRPSLTHFPGIAQTGSLFA